MTTRQSGVQDPKARLRVLLKRIWNSFDSASQKEQRRLLSALEELARPERRKHPRALSLIPVTIDGAHSGTAGNLSAGGALIRAPVPFSVGQEVTMDFTLPGSDQPCRMTGKVIWTHQMAAGVEFTSASKDLEDLIESP